MKKQFVLWLIIMPLAGLFLVVCDFNGEEVIVKDFSLKVTVDKTEAKKGDTVKTTVVFKNLSGRDIEAELPDWLTVGIRQSKGIDYTFSKEDILTAYLVEKADWWFNSVEARPPLPKILIESGDVIVREFEHTVTGSKNLKVQAAAFFITPGYPTTGYGLQIENRPIRITVR